MDRDEAVRKLAHTEYMMGEEGRLSFVSNADDTFDAMASLIPGGEPALLALIEGSAVVMPSLHTVFDGPPGPEAGREMERTALFRAGTFTMHSGGVAAWKIECDSLTSADWAGLAAMAVERIGPFGNVVGVPRGGIPFADALRPYATTGPRLVVDDVLTTGASMLEVMRPGDNGLVAFARGPLPEGIEALFVTGDVARERDALKAATIRAMKEAPDTP